MRPAGTRTAGTALGLLIAAFAWLQLGPVQLGGGSAYVTTHGTSMAPGFATGDLAVVRPATRYEVGDVAAYRSSRLDTVILHRIIAVDGDRYSFQGDNNDFVDPEQPTRQQLLGRLAVHVPQGGVWLRRLTSPAVAGAVAFLLLAGSGTAVHARRRRRGQVSRHAAPAAAPSALPLRRLGDVPRPVRTTAATAAGLAVGGLALALLTLSAPVAAATPVPVDEGTGSLAFGYSAAVRESPAYDGTVVHAPDPVFRSLARTVDVTLGYRGSAGTLTVDAELSAPSGWHATVPLAAPARFAGSTYDTDVRLDLDALEARARAAAAATRMPVAPLTVAVVATVRTRTGTFTPRLPLLLTPQQLKLTGDAKTLTVTGKGTQRPAVTTARTVELLGRPLPLGPTRLAAGLLLAAGLAGGGALPLLVRRSAAGTEGARIRRTHADLLCEVLPIPSAPDRAVVDVTEFAALARMAERYGLLVLHWAHAGGETFMVHEGSSTYRFRTGAPSGQHAVTA
jgi:signal peptidase I